MEYLDMIICLFYGITATMMNIANKIMISYFNFRCTFIALFTQYTLMLICIESLKRTSYKPYLPKFTWNHAISSLPVTSVFLFNIAFGLYGLATVNLPMFVALRKLSTLVVFLWDIFINNKKIELLSSIGILFIGTGALIAGVTSKQYNDLTYDLKGYCFVCIANLLTAGYLQLSNKLANKHPEMTAIVQSYYNGLLSLPLVFVLIYALEEHVIFATHPYTLSSTFLIGLFMVSTVGFLSSFSSFLCTTQVSPMATTITGQLKVTSTQDFISMFIGIISFPDVIPTPLFISGLCISSLGALIYSIGKYLNNRNPS